MSIILPSISELPRNIYDSLWQTDWDDMKIYGPYARHLRRIVLDLLSPLQFSSVLDVGCGQGALLEDIRRYFPDRNLSFYGTDFSISALQIAQDRISSGAFCAMDITRNTLARKFDLVLCTDVLEHIEDDSTAIRNLSQLTDSYIIIVTVQGRMRPHEPHTWGHVRNYRYGELVKKITKEGLRPLQIVNWGFPFFSPLYRDVNWLLGGRGTGGKYGPTRKLLAEIIYQVFRLNSHYHGDEIFILAQPYS